MAFAPRDRDWHPKASTPKYQSTTYRSPKRPLVHLPPSSGDLCSPVFGHQGLGELDNDMIRNAAGEGDPIGERIIVSGRVLDEFARPQPDVLIEIWQANAGGRYRHVNDSYLTPLDPNFSGYGRCVTDREGYYSFRTIRPGPYPYPNHGGDWRPAHVHLSLFGNAFLQRLITQFNFEGDPLISRCAIVNTISNPEAIDRLVARLDMENAVNFDCLAYKFDIVLRGRQETPRETGSCR